MPPQKRIFNSAIKAVLNKTDSDQVCIKGRLFGRSRTDLAIDMWIDKHDREWYAYEDLSHVSRWDEICDLHPDQNIVALYFDDYVISKVGFYNNPGHLLNDKIGIKKYKTQPLTDNCRAIEIEHFGKTYTAICLDVVDDICERIWDYEALINGEYMIDDKPVKYDGKVLLYDGQVVELSSFEHAKKLQYLIGLR